MILKNWEAKAMGEMGRPLAIGFLIVVSVILILIGIFKQLIGSAIIGVLILGLIYFLTRKKSKE